MTTFEEFHQKAWNDHAEKASVVSARIPDAFPLVVKPEQVPLLAKLIVHVDGEHLGLWPLALSRIDSLRTSAASFLTQAGAGESLDRATRTLKLCSGDESALMGLSVSDRIRVLAVAGAAFAGQCATSRATALFQEAAQLGERGLEKTDPAHRDLAVAGNNLAFALEEKARRSSEEDSLMIFAAKVGRRHWEVAGTWLHVMRAEYRLAMSHTQAGLPADAVRHAEISLELAAAHEAGATDIFFLYEALGLAERSRGNLEGFAKATERAKEYFGRLSNEDKEWCAPVLKKLTDLI